MGLFGGKPDTQGGAPAPSEPRQRPMPATSQPTEAPTVIGSGTTIKGELRSRTDMLIEGRVEGKIHSDKRVIIGQGGDVQASVHAEIVIVRGKIQGDCEASGKVEITATGRVFGNISARIIAVAEGATFRGSSKMAQDSSDPKSRPTDPAGRSGPTPRVGPSTSSAAGPN